MANTKSIGNLVSVEELTDLDAEKARSIFAQGEEAVVFALLQLVKQLSDSRACDPGNLATPSGMIPPYQKPPGKKRKKKSGAKANHAGTRRQQPERIDHFQDHRQTKIATFLECCLHPFVHC